MIKKLLAGLATALICLSASADSFTYTWVGDVLPPAPHGIKRVTALGSFTIDLTNVQVNGDGSATAYASDEPLFLIRMTSPANYFYRTFDGGSWTIDLATGAVLGGDFHATDASSTYGRGVSVLPTALIEDNFAGGSWHGHWAVTYNP